MTTPPRAPDPTLRRGPLRFRIRRGLDIPIAGKPEQNITEGAPVTSVALVGEDHAGLKPSLEVRVGDRVRPGQALFRDRRDPRILFTSPGTGTVAAIHRGTRRSLQSVVIALDDAEQEANGLQLPFAPHSRDALRGLAPSRVVEILLASGLWTALRARPFGKVPPPDAPPAALFVTAVDTNPLAPAPEVVIGGDPDAFTDGLIGLSRLLEGPVYLCTGPQSGLVVPDGARITVAEFSGPHPSGLVGTHMDRLSPASASRAVWYVGYQDVMAVGRLLTGRAPLGERVVALAGPAVKRPRLIRTRLGAHLDELLGGELIGDGPCRVVSGSVLGGRLAAGPTAFLGRYHHQISVLPEPIRGPASAKRGRERPWSFLLSLPRPSRRRAPGRFTTAINGSRRAMIPYDVFERAMPLDVLPAPLLRALLMGDAEQADSLGCLELEEEDLALCTFLCPAKNEYGPLLRAVLERLEGTA